MRHAPFTAALSCVVAACQSAPEPVVIDESGPLARVDLVSTVPRAHALELIDVDGDGHLDLVVSGEGLDVLRNDGRGGFARMACAPLPGPGPCLAVECADVDGDGRLDLLAAEHDEGPYVFVFLGDAEAGFVPAPRPRVTLDATPHLHTLEVFDVDGDGHVDLVSDSWPEDRLVVARGKGDGTFVEPGEAFAVPPTPIQNLAAGDMDGDGVVDLVTPAHEREAVSVLLGDGRGGFALADGAPFASFGGFSTLALADLDADGDLDVAEVHRSDSSTRFLQDGLSILLNDGAGRLSHAPGSPHLDLSGRAVDLAIADVNGDGLLDVVTISETTQVASTFLGGPAGLRFVGHDSLLGRPTDIAAGDVDGDGRAEVFIARHRTAELLVLRAE